MSQPPLAAFLEAAESAGTSEAAIDPEAFAETEARLTELLADVIASKGIESIATATGVKIPVLEAIAEADGADESNHPLTLRTAAAILSATTAYDVRSVRARLRDHILVMMSRGQVDASTVCDRYGFGDLATFKAKIEGEEPFSLREYARLRVVLRWIAANRKP